MTLSPWITRTSIPRTWIPRTGDSRIRLITLTLGLVLSTAPAPQLLTDIDNGGTTGLSVAALVVLLAVVLITAVIRRQLSIWEGPATALLTVLIGIGLGNPLNVVPICIGVIIAQSMYGGWLSELLRLIAFVPVLPLTVALSVSPLSQGVSWHSPAVLSVVPSPLIFGVLMHMVKSARESQAQAERRARFMSRLTGDLLGADTGEQAMPILMAAGSEICRISPGVVMIASRLRRGEAGATTAEVEAVFGADLRTPLAEIPADVVAKVPSLVPGRLVEIRGVDRRLASLGLRRRYWWFAYGGGVDARNGLGANLRLFGVAKSLSDRLFGIPGAEATELIGVLAGVNNQGRVALSYLAEQQALLAASSRDDVTGLTKRTGFLAQLDQVLEGGGQVALILVGVDGVTSPAEQDGPAAAAVTASRSARRLIDVVGDRGLTGRFSDARFAVAVPLPVTAAPGAQDTPDEADLLVADLRRVLGEPIEADGFTCSPSITIGVARTATGTGGSSTTGWDLVERAALALRADRKSSDHPMLRSA